MAQLGQRLCVQLRLELYCEMPLGKFRQYMHSCVMQESASFWASIPTVGIVTFLFLSLPILFTKKKRYHITISNCISLVPSEDNVFPYVCWPFVIF